MKRRLNPLRARIVLAATCLFAVAVFTAVYFQIQALGASSSAERRGRSRGAAQIVKLYLDLSYEGDWEARSGSLIKGSFEFVDDSLIRRALSDYLTPDTRLLFKAGEPPIAQLGNDAPPRDDAPPPDTAPPPDATLGGGGPRMIRPDMPFITQDGVGIAVRDASSKVVGWISVESGQERESARGNSFRIAFIFSAIAILLAVVAVFGFLVLRLTKPIDRMAEDTAAAKAKSVELASISMTDHLTGLLNRRGLEAALEGSAAMPSHVAMLDVDHFKSVNDERGHDEGDRVLASIAEVLSSCVRAGDLCGRWGGEEFVIVFRGTAGEHAEASAERIRAAVEARRFGSEVSPLAVTVTIGLAPWRDGGFEEAKASADEAMYRGKREGRNRVVVS